MITARVSLPGYDATTDTNPNHYIFHSDYNTFKILYQGSATVNVGTGSNIYTIPHNAPTTPPLLAIFCKFPDGAATPLSFQNINSFNGSHSVNTTYWDGTNIYLFDASVSTPYALSLSWYAFEPQL